MFLTTFYLRTICICNPQFILVFIEIIPLVELCNIYRNGNDLILAIEQLFSIYVEENLNRFENHIINKVKIFLNISKIAFVINSWNMIKIITTTHIISPETYKKIFSIKPLDICTIVSIIGTIIAYIWGK